MSHSTFGNLIPIRQNFPDRQLNDIPAAVRHELETAEFGRVLPPGARIAIGVGSRGVANIAVIARAVVDFFRSAGFRPFLFPAMGSHGAGTAAGQASVLAHYGIDESTMGCLVASSFDVISAGQTDLGIDVFAGRDAWDSDGIFVINRVKWHTSFVGAVESGLTKMLAIGLGKLNGARSAHAHARRIGMEAVIRSVGGHLLSTGKILGGLAIIEDARHRTAQVTALPAKDLIAGEEELLKQAVSWKGTIPVSALDVLILDEIGKNISGTGMDTKVVNRDSQGQYNPWPDIVRIERIVVRDLSDLSYGNATGIGMVDVAHDRAIARIDVQAGLVNARTSGSLATVRIPLHFPSDRECLELAAVTVGKSDPAQVTFGWLKNTLELQTMYVSESLADEISRHPIAEIAGAPFPLDFDEAGNLLPPGNRE